MAQGYLLADESGKPGERYILSGRNFTFDRLFADLARISGVAPPALKLPGRLMLGMVEAGARTGLPVPSSADEVRSAMLWWTYRNTRAKQELGFSPRPHEETWRKPSAGRRRSSATGSGSGGHGPEQIAARRAGQALRVGERVARG